MQGVFGGDAAGEKLLGVDAAINGAMTSTNKAAGVQNRLPKISDVHFNRDGKRRAASIPPRTAAAYAKSFVSPTNDNS